MEVRMSITGVQSMRDPMVIKGSELPDDKPEVSDSEVDHGPGLGKELLGVVLWTSTEPAAAFDFFGFGFRTERRRCLRAADS